MTTAEQLAIAVLKGDKDAIRALHDHLVEDFAPNGEAKELTLVTKKITVPIDRLRVIVYVKDDSIVDPDEILEQIRVWIQSQGGSTIVLPGVDRVEIYELPENFIPTREQEEVSYPGIRGEFTREDIRRVLQGDRIAQPGYVPIREIVHQDGTREHIIHTTREDEAHRLSNEFPNLIDTDR